MWWTVYREDVSRIRSSRSVLSNRCQSCGPQGVQQSLPQMQPVIMRWEHDWSYLFDSVFYSVKRTQDRRRQSTIAWMWLHKVNNAHYFTSCQFPAIWLVNWTGDIFECHTVFTRAIVGRVTLKKCHMREIYARTVRIEKPMAAVAAFLATS